jgi:hypothetical protein
MVQLGDHHLVAAAPPAAQRPRDVEGEGRHVVAERNLVRRCVEEVGECPPGSVDRLVGLEAGRKVPVRVRVVVQQVVGHPLHDAGRHLRAAGAVEVGDRVAFIAPGERLENDCGWPSTEATARDDVCSEGMARV